MNRTEKAIETIHNIYQTNENGIGDIFATTTLGELDPNTTIEELVEAWATTYKDIEGDEVVRSNIEEGTYKDVSTGKDVNLHNAETYTVQSELNDLIRYTDRSQPLLVSVWHEDDVQGIAEEFGVTLTHDEVRNVFSMIDSNFDSEYGINWESIRFAIEEVVNSRK